MRNAYRLIVIVTVALQVLGAPKTTLGDTMSSTSFIITSDDLTQGGGNISSTSFIAENDVGGKATGENINSTSYAACAGYPCTLTTGGGPSITFTVSPSTVNFGTLSLTSVSSGSVTETVTTNATYGYNVTMNSNEEMQQPNGQYLPHVALHGTVTAGTAGYGYSVSGADADPSVTGDNPIPADGSDLGVAVNSGPVTNSSVVVTFKAAINYLITPGNYTQTVHLIAVAQF
jgi:hypothetical protein